MKGSISLGAVLAWLGLFLTLEVSADSCTIDAFAGSAAPGGFSGDGGSVTSAKISRTKGLWMSSCHENLYFADMLTNYRIRMVNLPSNVITTIAGSGTATSSAGNARDGDGGPATDTAVKLNPYYVCGDTAGNIYISDNDVRNVKVVEPNGIITTFAGTGSGSYSGDGGQATAAELASPQNCFSDTSSNIFFSTSSRHLVRRVEQSSRIITTFMGTTDGNVNDLTVRTSTALVSPRGIFIDSVGNFYVGDSKNRVLKTTLYGSDAVTLVLGDGVADSSMGGDGGPATSASFGGSGLWPVFDVAGNLFVTSTGSNVGANIVRYVKKDTGIINLLAGTGTDGNSGNGGAATSAQLLGAPTILLVAHKGDIYLSDFANYNIRKLSCDFVSGPFLYDTLAATCPTMSPTAQPSYSMTPSATPSQVPSREPTTSVPSEVPSQVPSATPTLTMVPSAVPSVSPSAEPTVVPSSAPSAVPSVAPSAEPSVTPSVVPSAVPTTTSPSVEPTVSPSAVPSVVPSAAPSATPSEQPTPGPTVEPTQFPSAVPSVTPSAEPSVVPSEVPSVVPSVVPSEQPSEVPSAVPSVVPSQVPSATPSVEPSVVPSTTPSEAPSAVPSVVPSVAPSEQPTEMPSAVPSATPSVVPSATPSVEPSAVPSATPSVSPSAEPSVVPSAAPTTASESPSAVPSAEPSETPSVVPSAEPSASPSVVPSAEPSVMPSVEPSVTPSVVPSATPSVKPSRNPSQKPTIRPSKAPSARPSLKPTPLPTVEFSGVEIGANVTISDVHMEVGARRKLAEAGSMKLLEASDRALIAALTEALDLPSEEMVTIESEHIVSSEDNVATVLVVFKILAPKGDYVTYEAAFEAYSDLLMESTDDLRESLVTVAEDIGAYELYQITALNVTSVINQGAVDTSEPAYKDGDDLSDGYLAGVVIGVIVGALLLIALVYLCITSSSTGSSGAATTTAAAATGVVDASHSKV